MKEKLRLLVTTECNRKCPGCCNKDWNLKALEPIESIEELCKYKEILITGGEPMIYWRAINNLAHKIKDFNRKNKQSPPKIFVYTAHIVNLYEALVRYEAAFAICDVDGFHVTIHEDITKGEMKLLNEMQKLEVFNYLSMRLQIFPDVEEKVKITPNKWKRITFNPWITNCPLPIDEDFKRWTGGL